MSRRGCGCCATPNCQEPLLRNIPAHWTVVDGGTVAVSSVQFMDLDLNGEVNPSTFFPTVEAYEIRFAITGKVTITIDGLDYVADSAAYTVSVGGASDVCGKPGYGPYGADGYMTVVIRVTPTHSWIYGEGNIFDGNGFAHAIQTADRSANPSMSFKCVWVNATVGQFEIRDSECKLEEDAEGSLRYVKNCFFPLRATCAYSTAKSMSKDHKYLDDPTLYRNYFMPDWSHSGWDPIAVSWGCSEDPPNFVTGYVLVPPPYPTWQNYDPDIDPTSDWQTMGMWNGCVWNSYGPVKWYSFEEDDPENPGSTRTRYGYIGSDVVNDPYSFFATGGGCQLKFRGELRTVANAYPKPDYDVWLFIGGGFTIYCDYESWSGTYRYRNNVTTGGDARDVIDCNDIQNGFTLTIAGEVTFEPIEDYIPVNGYDIQCYWFNPDTCEGVITTPDVIAAAVDPMGCTWSV